MFENSNKNLDIGTVGERMLCLHRVNDNVSSINIQASRYIRKGFFHDDCISPDNMWGHPRRIAASNRRIIIRTVSDSFSVVKNALILVSISFNSSDKRTSKLLFGIRLTT